MAIDEAVIAGLTATYDDHGVVFWLRHWAQSDEASRRRGEGFMRGEGLIQSAKDTKLPNA